MRNRGRVFIRTGNWKILFFYVYELEVDRRYFDFFFYGLSVYSLIYSR
jgi:hypothetical protein